MPHGRANVDTLDDVARRPDLLLHIVKLGLRLAQLLDAILDGGGADLRDLLICPRDLLLRIRHPAEELAEIAGKARLGALQLQDLGLPDQLALKQRVLVLELLVEELEARLGRLDLGLVARDALLEGGDFLLQHLLLGVELAAPRHELRTLPVENGLDVGIVEILGKSLRHRHLLESVDFCGEPRLDRHEPELAKHESPELRVGGRVVESDQRLPCLDEIAFLDEHLAHNAALEMLHLLVLARGHERPRGDDRAVEGS
jgi:hypothetical protein